MKAHQVVLLVAASFWLGGFNPRINADACSFGYSEVDVEPGYWYCKVGQNPITLADMKSYFTRNIYFMGMF